MKVKVTKKSWMEEQVSFTVKPEYCCEKAEKHLHVSPKGEYVYMNEYVDVAGQSYPSENEVKVKWCPFCGTLVSIE